MSEKVKFEVLSESEIHDLAMQDYGFFVQKARDCFFKYGDKTLPYETQQKIIKRLAHISLLHHLYSSRNALNPNNDILNTLDLNDLNNLDYLQEKMLSMFHTYATYKSILDETVREGMKLREKLQPRFPKILDSGRLVIKVPSILPAKNQLQVLLDGLNEVISKGEDAKKIWCLDVQTRNGNTSYHVAFNPNGKADKSQKNKVKAGSFLYSKLKDLDALNRVIASFDKKTFDAFLSVLNNNETLTQVVETDQGKRKVNCLKVFNQQFQQNVRLDEELFLMIKEGKNNLSKYGVQQRILGLRENLDSVQQALSYEQEKQQAGRTHETDDLNTIDMIVFSTNPRQIAWMSAYTDYLSCMAPSSSNHYYVKKDIGHGTFVVWGVNSKQPHRRISRLLIKPYTSTTGDVKYHVTHAMYGQQNEAFHNYVKQFVDENMQDYLGKSKVFSFDEELYLDHDPLRDYEDISSFEDFIEVVKSSFRDSIIEKQPDGSVLITSNLSLSVMQLNNLPDLSSCIVRGVFDCSGCNFTSLKGFPQQVQGCVNCTGLKISSLEGIPEILEAHLNVEGCKKLASFQPLKKVNGVLSFSVENEKNVGLLLSMPHAQKYEIKIHDNVRLPQEACILKGVDATDIQLSGPYYLHDGQLKHFEETKIIEGSFSYSKIKNYDLSKAVLEGELLVNPEKHKRLECFKKLPHTIKGCLRTSVCYFSDLACLPKVEGKLVLKVDGPGFTLVRDTTLPKNLQNAKIELPKPYFIQDNKVYAIGRLPQDFVYKPETVLSLLGYSHEKGNLKTLPDGTIEVQGDINLSMFSSKTLPDFSEYKIKGKFGCLDVTSLKGAPKEVEGDFICTNSVLDTLEGMPSQVGGRLVLRGTTLNSLKGVSACVLESGRLDFDTYAKSVLEDENKGVEIKKEAIQTPQVIEEKPVQNAKIDQKNVQFFAVCGALIKAHIEAFKAKAQKQIQAVKKYSQNVFSKKGER